MTVHEEDLPETEWVAYDQDCGTIAQRPDDLGKWDVICAASHAGHPCVLDHDSLDHWDRTWDTEVDGHWLIGVTHRCGCDEPRRWPEVA